MSPALLFVIITIIIIGISLIVIGSLISLKESNRMIKQINQDKEDIKTLKHTGK